LQESLHIKHGHPFHPWANEDEIWLADFIFTKARMSMSITDDLLNGFKCGRINMQGCSPLYRTNKQLMEQLDEAEFVTVCIQPSLCHLLEYFNMFDIISCCLHLKAIQPSNCHTWPQQ
jgi:hypothetical protein